MERTPCPGRSERSRASLLKAIYYLIVVIMVVYPASENIHAYIYAEVASCNTFQGRVVDVVNDEEFTIALCEDTVKFKEFSYCYGVEAGDVVIFEWLPTNCEAVSFTVLRNGVQCGVMCP